MILQHTHPTLPFVPNPCVPYGAQGLDSSVLIWRHDQEIQSFASQTRFKRLSR